MGALSSAQQSEVKAWEEEILACEHTLTLVQEPVIVPGQGEPSFSFLFPTALVKVANLPTSVPSQCASCDLVSKLRLWLTCGLANCGRQQHGGIGGNGHALLHFQETGHGVGVKLGTITAEGTAGKSNESRAFGADNS